MSAERDDYTTKGRDGDNIPVDRDEVAEDAGADNVMDDEEGAEVDAQADSDEQLQKDDNDAIDKSNIVEGRTRGAEPAQGYREPGDNENIPDQ